MATMIRWNPTRDFSNFRAMDRFFDDALRGNRQALAAATTQRFPLDVHESKDAYVVIASLPGFNTENINISIEDDVLTITAERAQEEVTEGTNIVLSERRHGKFSRSIRLPQAINVDAVEANLDAGLLTLSLPKSPEAQPRLITVKAGKNGSPSNN